MSWRKKKNCLYLFGELFVLRKLRYLTGISVWLLFFLEGTLPIVLPRNHVRELYLVSCRKKVRAELLVGTRSFFLSSERLTKRHLSKCWVLCLSRVVFHEGAPLWHPCICCVLVEVGGTYQWCTCLFCLWGGLFRGTRVCEVSTWGTHVCWKMARCKLLPVGWNIFMFL